MYFNDISTGLYRFKQLPTKEEMTNPRSSLKNFTTFCDNFLICTHGKIEFRAQVQEKRVSTITTISTEAYTIAYIENSYDSWLAEAMDTTTDPIEWKANRVSGPQKKWTVNAHAAKIYGGWHKDGLIYYLDKSSEVRKERKTGQHHELEDDYMEGARGMYAKKVRAPRAVTEETDLVLEMYSEEEEEGDDEESDEE